MQAAIVAMAPWVSKQSALQAQRPHEAQRGCVYRGDGLEAGPCDTRHRAYLKDSECAQTGVKRMAGTLGCTMEPPAATE